MGSKLSLLLLSLAGIIVFIVSLSYIPSQGGTIPQGMDPDEYKRQQQQSAINSDAFKVSIGGICITCFSLISIGFINRGVKPERKIKVTRFAPHPHIIVDVKEDPVSPPS